MVDTERLKAIREAKNLLIAARRAGGDFPTLDRIWGALNYAADEAKGGLTFALYDVIDRDTREVIASGIEWIDSQYLITHSVKQPGEYLMAVAHV